MIYEAPLALASPQLSVAEKVRAYIAAAQSATADGLTWREFGGLSIALVRLLVESLDAVAAMTGEQKKAAVVDAVARLFDAVADKAVPLSAWPLWVIARPAVRSLVIALAAGAVEPILALVRSS